MKIAFMGHKDDSSDIYIIDLVDNEIKNLTNDIFSESSPSWAPDGSKIYFTSDRGINSDVDAMFNVDFSQTDIYQFDFSNSQISQITSTAVNENYPIASTDGNLFYTSDHNGITNIFKHNLSNLSLIHI